MFEQLLTPVAGSLPLSSIVAALPVAAVLVLLGVMRQPGRWRVSLFSDLRGRSPCVAGAALAEGFYIAAH
jgi:hypothetical protein